MMGVRGLGLWAFQGLEGTSQAWWVWLGVRHDSEGQQGGQVLMSQEL